MPIPSVHQLVVSRFVSTVPIRCSVPPAPSAAMPSRSGSYPTTTITATPPRNQVMIGADRNWAIQPSRSEPTGATINPTMAA